MKLLARAVITGFGLSIGAAIYKKLATQLGFEDKQPTDTARAGAGDAISDPGSLRGAPTHH